MPDEQSDEPVRADTPPEFGERLLLAQREDEEINQAVLQPMFRTGKRFWAMVMILGAIVAWGLYAWGYLVSWGIGTTGKNRPVYWTLFITTFVFWVGISHAGTMISAVLRIFKADWRRPITRGAEAMTAFALMMAGLYPLIHLGRVWKFYWMIPYPNNRSLWPNFQSPLMWDLVAIFTYLTGAMLYLYLALIPDMAMARDHTGGWRYKLYRMLSLGWRGTEGEWHKLHRALSIFSVAIIPIFLSVHSIVSWDFAVTIQPGWHISIFAPYFVIGAVYSGLAALASILVIIRRGMRLQEFLRAEHFNALGKLVMVARHGLDLLLVCWVHRRVVWQRSGRARTDPRGSGRSLGAALLPANGCQPDPDWATGFQESAYDPGSATRCDLIDQCGDVHRARPHCHWQPTA